MSKATSRGGLETALEAVATVYKNRKTIRGTMGKNAPKEKNSSLALKMGRPKRKATGGKKPDPKRQKVDGSKGDDGHAQTFYSAVDGKPMKKTLANLYKVVSANTVRNKYEFNGTNAMYNAGGAYYPVVNGCSGGSGTISGFYPLHLVDLTAVPNVVGGSIIDGNSGMQTAGQISTQAMSPYFTQLTVSNNSNTGNYYFTPQPLITPMKVVAAGQAANNQTNYPGPNDQFNWSSIKLNLYGAKQVPLKWNISFIKLKKDYLHPSESTSGATGVWGTPDEITERNAFYQSLTQPLMYNPILPQNGSHLKDMTILKSDTFRIEPKATTENDPIVHVKTVEYFERWNKDCDYSWGDLSTIVTGNASTALQTDLGWNKTTVVHKDRIYMMITCEAFTNSAVQNQYNINCNGSYDLMVKHCHTRLQ